MAKRRFTHPRDLTIKAVYDTNTAVMTVTDGTHEATYDEYEVDSMLRLIEDSDIASDELAELFSDEFTVYAYYVAELIVDNAVGLGHLVYA